MHAQLVGRRGGRRGEDGRASLALYSKPDFDPNDLAGGGGQRARARDVLQALLCRSVLSRPLLDKTMSGAFQPGSTFKPFSALAALEDKLVDPEQKERCDGYLMFGRKIFRCAHVHGKVDMRAAIAESCNIYFTHVAEAVGMDRLARMANEFGLGAKTGIGVNPEAAGRVPTRSWYALRYRGQFRLGFTLNAAIGQGAMSVTPLQLALAYAALGNGGTLYMPQLVRSVETSDGAIVSDFPPRVRHKANVRPGEPRRVNMEGPLRRRERSEGDGLPRPRASTTLDVAGKTGTAQTGYVATKDVDSKTAWYLSQDHAWFAAFSPSKAPEIALVVLVEHGGSGPTQAAPLAMQIIRDYERLQAVRAGRPLPKLAASHKATRARRRALSAHAPRGERRGGASDRRLPLLGRSRDHFDWALFLVAALLGVIGVVNLYSATSVLRASLSEVYVQQVYWLVFGGILATVVAAIDYRHYERLGYLLYAVGIVLLLLVFILGRDIRGSSRWIYIGSFSFQPSEFMKLFLCIALAKYLHDDPKSEERSLKDLVVPAILTGVPTLLVLKQPDLGTALILFLMFVSISALVRFKLRQLLYVTAAGGVAARGRLELRPEGVPEGADHLLPEPGGQRARLRLARPPRSDRHRERRMGGPGLHARHAEPVPFPPRPALRLPVRGVRGRLGLHGKPDPRDPLWVPGPLVDPHRGHRA